MNCAAAIKMHSERDLLALIESCVLSVVKMGTLPSDKSLIQLGATSFDVINILNSLEEQLHIIFESDTANLLFECLLNVPEKMVAQSLLQIIIRDAQNPESCVEMSTEAVLPIGFHTSHSHLKEKPVAPALPFSPSTGSTKETLMATHTSSAAKRPLSSLLSSDQGLPDSQKRVHYEEATVGTVSWGRGKSFSDGR